jgi:hypothetical protein
MKKVLIFIGLKIVEALAASGLLYLGSKFYFVAVEWGLISLHGQVDGWIMQSICGSLILYAGIGIIGFAIFGIIYGNLQLVKKITEARDER